MSHHIPFFGGPWTIGSNFADAPKGVSCRDIHRDKSGARHIQ